MIFIYQIIDLLELGFKTKDLLRRNCENYYNFNNKKKNSIFLKYFYIDKSYNKPRTTELIKYFDNYQSFCFDLSLNSVINGDLNFNHKMSLI